MCIILTASPHPLWLPSSPVLTLICSPSLGSNYQPFFSALILLVGSVGPVKHCLRNVECDVKPFSAQLNSLSRITPLSSYNVHTVTFVALDTIIACAVYCDIGNVMPLMCRSEIWVCHQVENQRRQSQVAEWIGEGWLQSPGVWIPCGLFQHISRLGTYNFNADKRRRFVPSESLVTWSFHLPSAWRPNHLLVFFL